MALIDIASSKSVWRGMEYYKQNKVSSCTANDDGTYEGVVAGSGDESYSIHVDMEHPRKSTCNCPLANGIFPAAFGTAAMDSYMESQDSYSSLFEDKSKYNAIMGALAGVIYREMRSKDPTMV